MSGPTRDETKTLWIARLSCVTGAVLLSYGAWRAWPPAGFLVAGALLLVVGVGSLR